MKNILVPIDFSNATGRVLDLARQLGKAFGATIHLVHVREISAPLSVSPLGYGALGIPEIAPTPISEIGPNDEEKKKLDEWKTAIEQMGLKVLVHEPTGDVIEEIVRCAQKMKSDAIVMGRHGHGAMYNLLVGSVTEGVVKRANCAVVLVPAADQNS